MYRIKLIRTPTLFFLIRIMQEIEAEKLLRKIFAIKCLKKIVKDKDLLQKTPSLRKQSKKSSNQAKVRNNMYICINKKKTSCICQPAS